MIVIDTGINDCNNNDGPFASPPFASDKYSAHPSSILMSALLDNRGIDRAHCSLNLGSVGGGALRISTNSSSAATSLPDTSLSTEGCLSQLQTTSNTPALINLVTVQGQSSAAHFSSILIASASTSSRLISFLG